MSKKQKPKARTVKTKSNRSARARSDAARKAWETRRRVAQTAATTPAPTIDEAAAE